MQPPGSFACIIEILIVWNILKKSFASQVDDTCNYDMLTHWGRDMVAAISQWHFQTYFLRWKLAKLAEYFTENRL